MEQINLRLENFEGPFELLLRLIKVNKMEITEIRIYEITDQYITVLKAMEELDLDIASEFFVLAATLIEIKSRELLPKKKGAEAEIPSRDYLLHKLREYEFFRDKSYALMKRFRQDEIIVTKLPDTIPEEKQVTVIIPKDFRPEDFFLLYTELLERQREKKNTHTLLPQRIPLDSFKVEDKVEELSQRLAEDTGLSFSRLVRESSGKAETVVIFLAILEMVRNMQVRVYQDESGGEILIEERRLSIREEPGSED